MRWVIFILCTVCLTADIAKAAEIDLIKGRLFGRGNYSSQVVSATNNSGAPIATLKVECGFFRGTSLLSAGMGFAENVSAGQTVYVEVIASNAEGADKTDCRVGAIIR